VDLRGLVGVLDEGQDIASAGLRPERGDLSLPTLTLDMDAFERNADAMLGYAKALGLLLAPHAKTPMSPVLSQHLVDKGAWGLSVANLQQAAVMLQHRFRRLLVANQIGGLASGARFGRLLAAYPDTDPLFFVDSSASVQAVAAATQTAGRRLSVLIEVGKGRAGARDETAAAALIAEAMASESLGLAGVACYEGAVASASPEATETAIADLCTLAARTLQRIRQVRPEAKLYLSAGGSAFFDLVVKYLLPVVHDDGKAQLVLRSGAIFFHDHGVYQRALAQLDARQGFAPVTGRPATRVFTPALRVWAEVLSRPEPDLLICGMGMRDVSSDQDLPCVLALYRNGLALPQSPAQVFKLNDQHAFVRIARDHPAQVGDVVEFGISHPCTCIDRWRMILGRGANGAISACLPTYFG